MTDTLTPSSETTKSPLGSRIVQGVSVVIAITLLSGIAHGYLDGRWSPQVDLRAHGERLKDLPEQCGVWRLDKTGDLDAKAASLLRCYGSTVSEYVNGETGDRVSVAVLFGPRGPTAIHIPEICFDSIGTTQVSDRQLESIEIGGTNHSLWSVQFSQGDDPNPSIDAWYAWSDGGPWQASKYPRFWMTETLFKVQVSGPVHPGSSTGPCRDFLTAFLPLIEPIKQRN